MVYQLGCSIDHRGTHVTIHHGRVSNEVDGEALHPLDKQRDTGTGFKKGKLHC